ncbi:DgyrCDS8413 [Dimorphilus gyrociliatus]|uniref:DgyrCDS8413 n=1 Tax=Dimorphilus gyrociliatus TaxID=2664684 RepID=A0A7I8VU27_9ANNE|nr:DgyrCDS8413 [Dimorphilus gyrociliatus]
MDVGQNKDISQIVKECVACQAIENEGGDERIQFFCFPQGQDANTIEQLTEWLKICPIGFKPNQESYLCSRHFGNTCYEDTENQTLKDGAIPDLKVNIRKEPISVEGNIEKDDKVVVKFKNVNENHIHQETGDCTPEAEITVETVLNSREAVVPTQEKTKRTGAKCAVKSCKNRRTQNVSDNFGNVLRWFSFPFEQKRFEQWAQALGYSKLTVSLRKLQVCSDHFGRDDFQNPSHFQTSALKKTAVPKTSNVLQIQSESIIEENNEDENSYLPTKRIKLDVSNETPNESSNLKALSNTSIAPNIAQTSSIREKEKQKIVECILPGSNTILKLPVPESVQPGHTFFVGRDDSGKVEQILIPVSDGDVQNISVGQRPIAIKSSKISQSHLNENIINKPKIVVSRGNMARVTSAIVLENRPQQNATIAPSNGAVVNPIQMQQIKPSSKNDNSKVLDLSKEDDIKSLLNIMKTSADKTGTPVTVNVKATPEQEKMLRRIISSGSISGSVRNTDQLNSTTTTSSLNSASANSSDMDKVKQIDDLSAQELREMCKTLIENHRKQSCTFSNMISKHKISSLNFKQKYYALKEEIDNKKSESFDKIYSSHNLTSAQKKFFQSQYEANYNAKEGKNIYWDEDTIKILLDFYFKSPSGYKALCSLFRLPSVEILTSHFQRIMRTLIDPPQNVRSIDAQTQKNESISTTENLKIYGSSSSRWLRTLEKFNCQNSDELVDGLLNLFDMYESSGGLFSDLKNNSTN